MEPNDPLAALRDLHVPDAPPDQVLPVAALALAALLVAATAVVALLAMRRPDWQRQAIEELRRIRTGEATLAETAAILRRVAILKRGPMAGRLTGDAWLSMLDRLFSTTYFTTGRGQVFGAALYARPDDASADPLAVADDVLRLLRKRRWRPW